MKIKYVAWPLLIVILYSYLHLFANALTDDTFITLQYVKTLLTTGTWGFMPGYVTNAVTSPLNVFLLSFAGFLLGPTVNAILWLSACILALTVFLLARCSGYLFATEVFGYMAAGALIFNPLLISTLGLESILFVNLYVLSTYLYLTNRWSLLAVALGLITITRFDGILFFIVTLLLIPTFRLLIKFVAMYLLSIAPWYIFSWVYLGSFVPDTLFIKTVQRAWGNWDFLNGLDLYYRVYRLEIIFSILLLPLLFLLFNKKVRNLPAVRFLLLTGVAHFAGYSILKVPPYFWYYVPEITALGLIGSFSLGRLFQQDTSNKWRGTGLQGIATILIILQAFGMFYILMKNGFPIKEMPIHTNWATHEQYKEIGQWLKNHDNEGTILVDGEIGTIGYYCDCELSSFFSDRRWLEQYVHKKISGNGIKSSLYKVNFLFLDKDTQFPDPDYLLKAIPNGKINNPAGLMQWQTSTKWVPRNLIQLSEYSP
jgi:hypothetical protein